MESLALNLIRKLATTAVYLYLCMCLSVCVSVCVCMCLLVFRHMHGRGGETAVLVVSVKLSNYLIVPCVSAERDGIDHNWLRLLIWTDR